VVEVRAALRAAAAAAVAAGVSRDRIVLDPGLGFGKTFEHNLALLNRLPELHVDGYPMLIGVSRKAFLGHILDGAPAAERDVATAVACAFCSHRGAKLFRVHDARATRDALRVAQALAASVVGQR
jgi:dihydropteroate synthase